MIDLPIIGTFFYNLMFSKKIINNIFSKITLAGVKYSLQQLQNIIMNLLILERVAANIYYQA